MQWLHPVSFLLLVIGGLNWGLIGLLDFNLVDALVGSMPMVKQVVYILVGASAVYAVLMHTTDCKWCSTKKGK